MHNSESSLLSNVEKVFHTYARLTRFNRIPHISTISLLCFMLFYSLCYYFTGVMMLIISGLFPLYFFIFKYDQQGYYFILFMITLVVLVNEFVLEHMVSLSFVRVVLMWFLFFGGIGYFILQWKQSINTMIEVIDEIQLRTKTTHICCECKCMKHKGVWVRIEEILTEQGFETLSHGYCPKCYEKKLEEFGI